ncbi:MAG: hybrid sensor histidine kinase/response regulator [Oligoflexia bacterium]|nr:hybrid sensor histidine kinase/response regulator [Oligoflexia bacterium]
MEHTILIVDDEKDIVDTLERQFRKNYKVFTASSGYDALKILNKHNIHLILSDQRMPEMTGVQMLQKAQVVQPDSIRILLTGYTDVDSVIAAINEGQIYRYVTKPWDPTELEIVVKRALEAYDLKVDVKEKNKKLESAYKELKTLDEAKSHFMILIGHELKTPLTTINSFLSLLKEEVKTPEHIKYVERILQGTNRLNEIIFDVLDLLSAETGQLKINKSEKNIFKALNIAINTHLALVEKKKLKIDNKIKSDLKLQFDDVIIGKVLNKIIHNAFKFAQDNSTIEISYSNSEISVTNSGPTMSAAQISKILKPFTLDENIMHHAQGMGLGLSVSQALLKCHDSQIQIESQNNKTTVSFRI